VQSRLAKEDYFMDESQLLRGILEGCVLSVISQGETYGYEILARLEQNGFESLFEGTLYPVITRLENKELISCRKEKSPYGPIRKYYSITALGEKALDDFKESYHKISRAAEKTLFDEVSE
jgi:PadR family transcriptional regulator PadR